MKVKLDKKELIALCSIGIKRHEAKDKSFRNVCKHGVIEKYTHDYIDLYGFKITKRHLPHITGVMGEYAYGKLIGEDIDRNIYDVRDDGKDFKNGAEVKCSTFYSGRWGETELKIPVREYEDRDPTKYVLTRLSDKILLQSPNSLTVEALGEISSQKFDMIKGQPKQYTQNGPKNYVVKESDLDPIEASKKREWTFTEQDEWYFQ